jgi:stage II sporulation protein D
MNKQTFATQDCFAKNWLFRLTTSAPALRWSLRWWGGMLLWLLLVLPAQAAVELRVAIAEDTRAISVGSSTTGIIRDGSGNALYQLPKLQGITLQADANQVDLTNSGAAIAESSAFWLEPSEGGFVWIGDKWYRGRVMVTLEEGQLTAVNYVDLEKYLYSVVGSEMPTSWPQAALQSQAVAARSYALYKRSRTRSPLYDLDATTASQVYKGIVQEAPSTIAAVDTTANQVVTYNGQVIEAIFHSSSGGYTENAGEVWSSDVPYLQGVEDYDQNAPVYRWQETFSLSEFSDKVSSVGNVRSIGTPVLTTRGRVSSISITGDDGTETLKGQDIRRALGLRSTRFTITISANQVTIDGFGFGHGVGMSQWGARSLAEQGWGFEQILEHYYQSTAIAQLES